MGFSPILHGREKPKCIFCSRMCKCHAEFVKQIILIYQGALAKKYRKAFVLIFMFNSKIDEQKL